MKCKTCGEELPDRARFCLICGTPVDQVAAEPADESQTDTKQGVEKDEVVPTSSDTEIESEAGEGSEEPSEPVVGAAAGEPEAEAAEEAGIEAEAEAEAAADPEQAPEEETPEHASEPETEPEAEAEPAPAPAEPDNDPMKTIEYQPDLSDMRDMPASKRLEDPLDPSGLGAVPLVPVAPPPRATRMRSHGTRSYATSAGRQVFGDRRSVSDAPVWSEHPHHFARPASTPAEDEDQDDAIFSDDTVAQEHEAAERTEEGKPSFKHFAGDVRDRLGSVRAPRKGVIVAAVLVVAAALVVAFLGFFEEGLVAVMDVIRGYPDERAAYVGLLMVDGARHGHGIGTQVARAEFRRLRVEGFSRVRLAYIQGNEPARHFWTSLGFEPAGAPVSTPHYVAVPMERAI